MKKRAKIVLTMVAVAALAAMCLPLQATPASAEDEVVWTLQQTPTEDDLNSVFFIDEDNGWAVGLDADSDGVIYKTTNGGDDWTVVTSADEHDLYELNEVFFLDENTGWIVEAGSTKVHPTYGYARRGRVLKTDNGGVSWTVIGVSYSETADPALPIDEGIGLSGIYFHDASNGWIAGGKKGGTVVALKSTDGGLNWTDISPGSDEWVAADIEFVNATTGWMCAKGGEIWKTTNAGTSWTKQSTPGTITDMQSCLSVVDADNVYSCGFAGTIMHTGDGSAWGAQISGTSNDLRGISAVDADTAWAVGNSGTIVYTTDGGDQWDAQDCPTENDLLDVQMLDADTGYAVGTGGIILKYRLATVGKQLTITIPISAGSVTFEPFPPPGGYVPGTVVTLTAVPDEDCLFTGWEGALSGNDLITTITMDSDKSVTANFVPVVRFRLIANRLPADSGSVTLDPVQPEGGYEEGVEVTLTAVPAAGYVFVEWSGDISGTDATITIEIDGSKTVFANFAKASGCCAGAAATAADIGSGIGVIGLLGLAVTCLHLRRK